MAVPARVVDLGRCSYRSAYARQLVALARRKTGQGIDELIVVEHPHVITVGRARAATANVVDPRDIEVVEIERGGDATYHGPGQLVAYPVFLLREGERDLHKVLRRLEDAMLRTLDVFGIHAGREPGKTGVWCRGRKLASIGIACRRWVMFHGVALNVNTDLSYFFRINPCGFDPAVMTSMAVELNAGVCFDSVKSQLVADIGHVFGRSFHDCEDSTDTI